MKLGLIGAGRMGRPMLERLRDAGHDVTVYTRSAELRQQLRAADSLRDAVADAEVVVCVVQTDAQVREACFAALPDMRPGACLIQHTTCAPWTVEDLAVAASAAGVRVLDAALSGGPHDIAAGALTVWVGGEIATLELARPALSSYASPIIHVGPVGAGQRVKLVNNALFVAQVGLALDGMRLAEALGIASTTLLEALQQGSAASRALAVVARAGSAEAVRQRLSALMAKDLDVVREVAARAGAELGVIGSVLDSDLVERSVLGRTP